MDATKARLVLRNAINIRITVEMSALFVMFSEFSSELEQETNKLIALFSSIRDSQDLQKISFSGFFSENISSLADSVLDQLEDDDTSDRHLEFALSSVNFAQALDLAKQLGEMLPALTPLDNILRSADLLAYAAVLKTDSKARGILDSFLECFSAVFDKLETEQAAHRREEEAREAAMESAKQREQERVERLFDAARDNDVATFSSFLEQGEDLSRIHWTGKTALAVAVEHDSPDVLAKILELDQGSSFDLSYDSPIVLAVRLNRGKCLELLIRHGNVDLESEYWTQGLSILRDDILEQESPEALEVLLKNKMSPNEGSHFKSLIHLALSNKKYFIVDLLLKYGADSGILNFDKRTLFGQALEDQDEQALDVLASRHACNLGNEETTSLESLWNYRQKNSLSFADLLRRFELDLSAYIQGYNLLQHAVIRGDIEACRSLAASGADINALSERADEAALILAADADMIRCLIELGADVDLELDGKPLLAITQSAVPEFSQILLEAGARPILDNAWKSVIEQVKIYLGYNIEEEVEKTLRDAVDSKPALDAQQKALLEAYCQSVLEDESVVNKIMSMIDYFMQNPDKKTYTLIENPATSEGPRQATEKPDEIINEADVYIAYGQYRKAEELLKNAIKARPEKLEYQMKLLESFFASGFSGAFLALAKQLKIDKGDDAFIWGRVVSMGRKLCPGNKLFNDG